MTLSSMQTQDSKFEPWRSEAEHPTSQSRRLPTILTLTRGWGRNIFFSFKPPRPGTEPTNSAVKRSGANDYPRAPAPEITHLILTVNHLRYIFSADGGNPEAFMLLSTCVCIYVTECDDNCEECELDTPGTGTVCVDCHQRYTLNAQTKSCDSKIIIILPNPK